MAELRILTAGESHGPALVGILEGMPSGLKVDQDEMNTQLKRRQLGFGRGGRMQIESDQVEILSGLRFGITLGSPIAVRIQNRDWENWQERMGIWTGIEDNPVLIPRPGHADLAGAIKYDHQDLRNVLERASARETAMRVAVGSIIRQLLSQFDIRIVSHVIQIHTANTQQTFLSACDRKEDNSVKTILELFNRAEKSDVRCGDTAVSEKMREAIRKAQENGNSIGGIFEVAALNVPVGLGSHVMWDRRLDARIAAVMMGIPAIKAVEIGMGIECANRFGSEVHDPIVPGKCRIPKHTGNHAGGIEGGISNGEPILICAAMKPIPTLKKPLSSVNLKTGETVLAHKERSDICAVPAASIVGEAMLAIALGSEFCEKYGGDSITQMRRHFDADQRI